MKAAILSLQQELIDLLSEDYDVRMETVSTLPTLTVSMHNVDMLKVYPMKQGRFKLLDIEETRNSYRARKHLGLVRPQHKDQFTLYVQNSAGVTAYAYKYTRGPI